MHVRPALIRALRRPDPVAAAPQAAHAVLLAAVLLAAGLLPPCRGADGAIPPPPPAAFLSAPTAPVLIVRVYSNAARDDEFVELANAGAADQDLAGWSLTDLEDRATFPADTILPAGARLVATRNATSYGEDERRTADFTYDRGGARRMEGGVLRLADAGDEVLLCDPSGRVVDALVYGASTYAGPGWRGAPAPGPGRGEIATRASTEAGWEDHDDASDWDGLRDYRLGQSAFDPPPVEVGTRPTVLLSPDDGRGPMLSFLASAEHSVDAAVYTLTSDAIAAVLVAHARAGLRVRVLLEGSPVGGIEADERRLIGSLLDAGAEVRCLTGGSDVVKRYRYLHAKYAIVDGAAVLVSSENFGDSGFPPPGGDGNRGWSVIVEDLALARQLWEVFEEDFDPSRGDSVPAVGAVGDPPVGADAVRPWSPSAAAEARRMQLVLAPDNALSDAGVLGFIASATRRLRIEAFYADDPWGTRPNPLIEAAFAAARRGVSVQILLDGSGWSAEEDTTANEALSAILNERARREELDLEVRIFAPAGRVERIHNKGAVVDGRVALISSMNWAHGSATENREVGVLVEDREVAARLEAAFLQDWDRRPTSPGDDGLVTDPVLLLALYAFVAAASAASLRKMRRRDKGLKTRHRMVPCGLLRTHLRRGRREVRVLSPELVAEPRDGPGGGSGDRGGGEEALGGLGGPQGDRGP